MKIPIPRRPPPGFPAAFGGRRIHRPADRPTDLWHVVSRLGGRLAEARGPLTAVAVLVAAASLLELLGPYLLGVAIDRFVSAGVTEGFGKVALAMLGVYLAASGANALAAWLMAHLSQELLSRLRIDVFAHLQGLPLSFFDATPAGELMSRLTNDVEAVNQAFSQNVTGFLASVLSLAGIIVAMFLLEWRLALASLLIIPLMAWFAGSVGSYTRLRFLELQRDLGELSSVMEETISGQKVVKAFGRGEAALAAFRLANEHVFRSAVRANSYALLLMPLTSVLGNLFIIVLAALGGWLAIEGMVTVGVIAAFIHYGHNFISPLRGLANLYNSIQAALAGAERIFSLLDLPGEEDGLPAAAPPQGGAEVRFEEVTFSYVPQRLVIHSMTFTAAAGRVIAIVGPTGAGKTTLINLLCRFYDPQAGRITAAGRDIRGFSRPLWRRRLGVVLQEPFLFSGTVLENIRYGRLEATDEECVAAARVAGADQFIMTLPRGYETVLSERGGNLSHGQRQLVAISRAILADPEILILDEATSSVDARTELRIQQALSRLMAGRTSLVIAHRLSTIRRADLVLVVDAGRIVEQGTHAELLARKGFYHDLYLSQFRGL